MSKIEVELDEQTLERARQRAKASGHTLEQWLRETLERAARNDNPLVGLCADEPELLDEVVATAMEARESDPLRRDVE